MIEKSKRKKKNVSFLIIVGYEDMALAPSKTGRKVILSSGIDQREFDRHAPRESARCLDPMSTSLYTETSKSRRWNIWADSAIT